MKKIAMFFVDVAILLAVGLGVISVMLFAWWTLSGLLYVFSNVEALPAAAHIPKWTFLGMLGLFLVRAKPVMRIGKKERR